MHRHRKTDKLLNELFDGDWRVAAIGSADHNLYAFVDAELSGQDAQAKFPTISAEIASNSQTRILYTELKELLLAESEGQLVAPPAHRFNFAFLQTEAKVVAAPSAVSAAIASVPWRLNEVGRLVIEFSTQFLDSLVPPAPQFAGVKSVRSKAGKTLLDYMLGTEIDDLAVQIVARERSDDPSLCTVTVKVDIPSRGGWPHLGEIPVALTTNSTKSEQSRSMQSDSQQRQLTDAFGEVHFENVNVTDLPNLQFEIDSGTKS